MKKKLVYIVNRIDGPGGLERVLSIKASMLADQYDYEVHIVTLNQDEQDLFYDFSPKIKYHNIKAGGTLFKYAYQYASGLRKMIKQLNPDIISVCDDGLKGLFVAAILGKPCPMIYERHVSKNAEVGGNQSGMHKMITAIKFRLMNFGGSFYDHFVVLTKGNLNEWKLKNLKVIPNPLSFYPDAESQSTLQNKKVLAVGKQSFQKGYDRLLESWQKVSKKHSDWELNIYGTIAKEQKLDEQAKALGVDNTVHLYAPVKNIADKYKEASIYVMSSRYEGFGMVLTEAMAYGVPCVSFDCPYGPSDIITDKEDGILVDNGDIDGLANGLIHLIENNESRIGMGQKARKSVERYLPKHIVKEWDALFTTLIQVRSK